MSAGGGPTLGEIRERLAGLTGRAWWRGLEEAAGTPGFREALQREFPAHAAEWTDAVSRRRFLSLMGASLALAGVTACTRQPRETISPWSEAPEGMLPGQPLHYATALTLGGYALGVLVETHEGRPTKIEGNPDHPASLGATDVFMQAAILGLYDPDRSRTVTRLGDIRPWSEVLDLARSLREVQTPLRGRGLWILTETVTSPTLAWQIGRLQQMLPEARWCVHEPAGRDQARAGAVMAFGEPVASRYDLSRADVILSLDADFMAPGPAALRHIRQFAARRRGDGGAPMSRLYVAESMPSRTGAAADHRLPLRSGAIGRLARAVAGRLGLPARAPAGGPGARLDAWAAAVAADLAAHRGACLVLAGDTQPPEVHALAHAINHTLGCAGRTVAHTDPIEAEPAGREASLVDLVAAIDAGRVDILLILGGNPVYTAPADLDVAHRLEKVGMRIHLSGYQDETTALCQWHVPQAHELESWGDARAFDGTVTIQQPMIEPLYSGRTSLELLAAFLGQPGRTAHDIVRDHWKERRGPGGDFESWWRRSLHDGLVAGSAAPERAVTLRAGWPDAPGDLPDRPDGEGLEAVFRLDASVHDGRYANNGWLQELPDPITKLTWDNAAMIAPATAERLGLASGDVVVMTLGGRRAEGPIWIVPGHAPDAVTLPMGYGRRRAGRAGSDTGFDVYALRASAAPWIAAGLTLVATGRTHPMACTQTHQTMEGRDLVRRADAKGSGAGHAGAVHAAHGGEGHPSLYPPWPYEGHAWGMSIDLAVCVGCNACVIGCQAENNIPVVGKPEVLVGREMHWIRVDRYFEGGLDEPEIHHQPVPCMQCENAPCEPVCPVGATVHSSEGLNDMVYNRCVGTRYCANNCPYKVRRFNFLHYADVRTPSLRLLNNPDVTVRSRGVMEKCTYCVQRINRARVAAHKQGRPIRDGEIVTACQQACPAQAIVFGDINDPDSRVTALKADPRDYALLAELGTRPRTTYLAALKNPNPALAGEG